MVQFEILLIYQLSIAQYIYIYCDQVLSTVYRFIKWLGSYELLTWKSYKTGSVRVGHIFYAHNYQLPHRVVLQLILKYYIVIEQRVVVDFDHE